MSVGLFAGAASAATTDFVGTWVTPDPNTRDITRVIVTPNSADKVNVQVFGRCHPSDCDWKTVTGIGFSASVSSADVVMVVANFNPGFARTTLILRPAGANALHYDEFTEFTDGSGRHNYQTTGQLNKVEPPGPEDCIAFDPKAIKVSNFGGRWKIVQGSMWMLDFGANRADADRSLAIIRNYMFNQQCFVKRPNPPMKYWKIGSVVPHDAMAGQDCVDNNPNTTTVSKVGSAWKVVDGSHWMLDFGANEAAARQALAVIKYYRLNKQCFVHRPNPPMTYWLAE